MDGEFNPTRMSWFLFRKYNYLDPMITWEDINQWVLYFEYLHKQTNPNVAIITYVWRKVLDQLRDQFILKYRMFIVDQEELKEQSINYENYLIEKIDLKGKEFDTSKYFLGDICLHGHEFKNTGKSLRYKCGDKSCIACLSENLFKTSYLDIMAEIHINESLIHKTISARNESIINNQFESLIDFDTDKFRIGALCKYEHDWKNTGHSLRYKKGNSCRECLLINQRAKCKS